MAHCLSFALAALSTYVPVRLCRAQAPRRRIALISELIHLTFKRVWQNIPLPNFSLALRS